MLESTCFMFIMDSLKKAIKRDIHSRVNQNLERRKTIYLLFCDCEECKVHFFCYVHWVKSPMPWTLFETDNFSRIEEFKTGKFVETAIAICREKKVCHLFYKGNKTNQSMYKTRLPVCIFIVKIDALVSLKMVTERIFNISK
jgi:hypothetical protein